MPFDDSGLYRGFGSGEPNTYRRYLLAEVALMGLRVFGLVGVGIGLHYPLVTLKLIGYGLLFCVGLALLLVAIIDRFEWLQKGRRRRVQ